MKTTTPQGRFVSTRAAIARKVAIALMATCNLSSAATLLASITLSNITNNEDDIDGLVLEVYQIDDSHLLFSAANNSGDDGAAIDQIYFDNSAGWFSEINFSTSDSTGTVNFAPSGVPDNPPGTQSFNPLAPDYFPDTDIQFQAAASANPNPPPLNLSANENRVDSGEAAGFIATLNIPISDKLVLSDFRVAYHVQSLGDKNGGSDTYLGAGSVVSVPEPCAASIVGSIGMLILLRRRRF